MCYKWVSYLPSTKTTHFSRHLTLFAMNTQQCFIYFLLLTGILIVISECQNLHFSCGNRSGIAALTFDDGPHPEHTRLVLDVLKENNVKATFFLLGPHVWETNETRYLETVRRIVEEGHQIGSHTQTHPDLEDLSEPDIREQLSSQNEYITKHINKKMTVFRPPYGKFDDRVLRIAQQEFGYDVILWNVNTKDWFYKNNTQKAIRRWSDKLASKSGRNSSYIGLQHDTHGNTNLTQMTIDLLRSHGIRLTTVAECIGKPMYY